MSRNRLFLVAVAARAAVAFIAVEVLLGIVGGLSAALHVVFAFDGGLRFSTRDEYRYTESLVYPALGAGPRSVLVLGGGDGLVARELLQEAIAIFPPTQTVAIDEPVN